MRLRNLARTTGHSLRLTIHEERVQDGVHSLSIYGVIWRDGVVMALTVSFCI